MPFRSKVVMIAIEGIDGAGKTTAAKEIYNHLYDEFEGWEVSQLKFPSKQPPENANANWFLLDFIEVLGEKRKDIDESEYHHIIIIDRCFLSTAVYNGQDEVEDIVRQGYEIFRGILKPDLSIYYDCEVNTDVAARRILHRKTQDNPDEIDSIRDFDVLYAELLRLQDHYSDAFDVLLSLLEVDSPGGKTGYIYSTDDTSLIWRQAFVEVDKINSHLFANTHEEMNKILRQEVERLRLENDKLKAQVEGLIKLVYAGE